MFVRCVSVSLRGPFIVRFRNIRSRFPIQSCFVSNLAGSETKGKMSEKTENLVGSIDQGTSSSRFLIFSAQTGEIVTSHQIEVKQFFPNPGWVEMDPMEMLNATKECMKEACKKLEETGRTTKQIKAVGITDQRETTIVWDKHTGKPYYNAIVWLDARTSELAKTFTQRTKSKSADEFKEKSGLPIHPYFSALKLRWIIENVDEARIAIQDGNAIAGTVDTWLIWSLTGGSKGGAFVTDVTNASRTLLMDIHSCNWDTELCKFFGIPKTILPSIRSSAEVYGKLKFSEPDGNVGPMDGIPISGCLGDQQAALVGQNCLSQGMAKNTYGTGCFLLYNTGQKPVISKHGLLTTVAFQLGPKQPVVYALEGSTAIAGAAVRWLKDNLKLIKTSQEVETLAKSVESTHGVYFVPAFSGLYAPHWRPEARGLIVGLSQYSESAHVARATLEAVCFQTGEILKAMKKDSGLPLANLLVDGGMSRNNLMMQTQSDLLGITVQRPEFVETTALGAAIAAGMAPGVEVWNLDKTNPALKKSQIFSSKITVEERDSRFARWNEAVQRSMDWAGDNFRLLSGKNKSFASSIPILSSIQNDQGSSSAKTVMRLLFAAGVGVAAGYGIKTLLDSRE